MELERQVILVLMLELPEFQMLRMLSPGATVRGGGMSCSSFDAKLSVQRTDIDARSVVTEVGTLVGDSRGTDRDREGRRGGRVVTSVLSM